MISVLTKDKLEPEIVINPSTGEQETLTPVENFLDLQIPIEFKGFEQNIGALLLATSDKIPPTIVFGFSFPGIHSEIGAAELCNFADKIEAGLKQLPEGKMTIHFSAVQSDAIRQEELRKRGEDCDNHLLRLINASERKRTQELRRQGKREPKEIFIYCSYKCKAIDEKEKLDLIQSGLRILTKAVHQLAGKGEEFEDAELHELLMQAHKNGYIPWSDSLRKMGLRELQPLNGYNLYRNLYRRFNNCDPEFLPQILEVHQDHLEQVINTEEVHSVSYLFNRDTPSFHRTCVLVKNELQAVMVMDDKPREFGSLEEEFKYFWKKVAKDDISDIDIFAEVKRGSYQTARKGVEDLSRYSKSIEEKAAQHKDSTTKAERNISEAKALEHSLEDGNRPHPLAVVFVVRQKLKGFCLRTAKAKLAKKCRTLKDEILLPASLRREKDVAFKLWLQTLPATIDDILTSQFENKKLALMSNEVWGLLPLVNTVNLRRGGFEFIANDGSSPVNFNILDKQSHVNALIFATTRAGKSLLLAQIIVSALIEKVRTVVLDYPKSDGSSTFDTLTKRLGELGAYFNIGEQFINLFERPPALNQMSRIRRETVMEDLKGLIEAILRIRIFGLSESEKTNTPTYKAMDSILVGAIKEFYEDPDIIARFERAEREGMGSSAWAEMPVLDDFFAFCTLEKAKQRLTIKGVDFEFDEKILTEAVTLIHLGLHGLRESKVGQAISKPSSIKSDARLLAFAFRQVERKEDAAIMALLATAAAYRSALLSPQSVFIIDETPILFGYEIVAQCVHRVVSNGAKSGIHVIISAQGANLLERTEFGKEIAENMSVRIVGQIRSDAVPSFCRILGYTEEEIEPCVSFTVNGKERFSKWLLTDTGISKGGKSNFTTQVRYYIPLLLLGLVANNSDEQKVRNIFFSIYDNPDVALREFSKFLALSMRTGKSLAKLTEEKFGKNLVALPISA